MLRITVVTFAFLSLVLAARAEGVPGRFDYYVLALSWSPSWCAGSGRQQVEQCAGPRRHGLVVHGLWPQYEKGWPQSCAVPGTVADALVDDMLPLMPSRALIRHQWAKHGTCDGSGQAAYFARVKDAWGRLRIPGQLNGNRAVTLSPAEVERLFAAVNPGLTAQAMVVTCRGGRAAEIRICLDKSLNFRSCGPDLRETCKDSIQFPPIR